MVNMANDKAHDPTNLAKHPTKSSQAMRQWVKLSTQTPNVGEICDWKITEMGFDSEGVGFYYEQKNPLVCGFSDENGLMVSPPTKTYWRKHHGEG